MRPQNNFKVPFAYLDGEIVDIQTAKKGITYKCNCGSDVKLRGGELVRNHFYHIEESECSYESAIHKAYKDVFYQLKSIRLPYKVNGKKMLLFDRVELENRLGDYQPDAIGYIGDEMYLIEFAYTSFIGKRKLAKIKKSNIFCLEVRIPKKTAGIEEIKELLIKDSRYREIVHIPEYAEMREMKLKFTTAYRAVQEELREEQGFGYKTPSTFKGSVDEEIELIMSSIDWSRLKSMSESLANPEVKSL